MISVLIPVYNFDVRNFVSQVHEQSVNSKVPFEILCYDDGSDQWWKDTNQEISNLENVKYRELPQNIGRSKIRNLLAGDAQYQNLLFMDCDSRITRNDFIKKYIDHCDLNSIIYGGRSYEENPPLDQSRYFRWYYGVERETISAEKRKKYPYRSFMTNNFLIPKNLFEKVRFNESLVGYGHEDTLFGYQLKLKQFNILHIDNPLCHVGLETTTEFLKKTEEGIRNLIFIIEMKLISHEVKLLDYYKITKGFGLSSIVLSIYRKYRNKIIKNLESKHPNLMMFDLFKLGCLIEEERKRKKI